MRDTGPCFPLFTRVRVQPKREWEILRPSVHNRGYRPERWAGRIATVALGCPGGPWVGVQADSWPFRGKPELWTIFHPAELECLSLARR